MLEVYYIALAFTVFFTMAGLGKITSYFLQNQSWSSAWHYLKDN